MEETHQFFEAQPNNNQPKKTGKGKAIAAFFIVIAFFVGFAVGQNEIRINAGKLEINKGPSRSADYNLLWDALDLLNSKFVDKNHLDQKNLLYGAVKGLIAAAGDPYSVFFDPDESKEFAEELKGSFEGIGAYLGVKDNDLVIIAPIEGSPAARAGLLASDIIVTIDGESTIGIAVDEAASKIKGKAGTTVSLGILHPGSKQVQDITITRDTIKIPSVKFSDKTVGDKKIAVVTMNRFGEDTEGLFQHDVDLILSGGYDGIILDLRNNPGGYLDASVSIASNWIDSGQVVVKEVNYAGAVKDYNASGLSRLKGIKTMVLVNGGSASASEILAGALQDYKVATLIGEKTFGKGSVQELQDLSADTSIKITVAKWHTPLDRSIDKNGLEPDIKIERPAEENTPEKDSQMDKALEMFK